MLKVRNWVKAGALALAFNVAAIAPADAQHRHHTKLHRTPHTTTQLADQKPNRYAAIVVDADNGLVLYERDADQRLHPASTTKVMTAYLVFEALESGKLKMDQRLNISENAASQPRTNLGLMSTVGKGRRATTTQTVRTITVENALKGMLCHSANDAAVIFAEAIGGTEENFARMMNAKSKSLGMDGTHYVNPNGLPDDRQKTTVEDLALLSRAVIRDFPQYYPLFDTETFTFNGATYRNTNNLLGKYPGMDGIKTGWIATSGYNLTASAIREGKRVIGVVFGARSPSERKEDMTHLLDFGFEKMRNPDARFAFGRSTGDNGQRYVALPPKAGEEDAPDTTKTDTSTNLMPSFNSTFGRDIMARQPLVTPDSLFKPQFTLPFKTPDTPPPPSQPDKALPPSIIRQRGPNPPV